MTCPFCEHKMVGGKPGGWWRCTPCGLFWPVKRDDTSDFLENNEEDVL